MRFLLVKSCTEAEDAPDAQIITGVAIGDLKNSEGIYHHLIYDSKNELHAGAVKVPSESSWETVDQIANQALVRIRVNKNDGPKIRPSSVFVNADFEEDEVFDIYNEAQILRVLLDERQLGKVLHNWVLDLYNCYVYLKRTISKDGRKVETEPLVSGFKENGKTYKTLPLYTSEDIKREYMLPELRAKIKADGYELYSLNPVDMVKVAIQNNVTHVLINNGNAYDIYIPSPKSIEPLLDEAFLCDADMLGVFRNAEMTGELTSLPSVYQRSYHKACLTMFGG